MSCLEILSRKSPELAILDTFLASLNEFKKAEESIQIKAGTKIWGNLQSLLKLSPQQLNERSQELIAEYRGVRDDVLVLGAYATLMEFVLVSMSDPDTHNEIGRKLMEWLLELGIVDRDDTA